MNQIKQGYKQTKVGIIPENWKKIELGEILCISSKKFNPIGNNENKKCVELEYLSQETGKLLGYTNSREQQSIKNSFEDGQVLFGKLRPYLKKFWKADFDGVCSSEIWVMSGKKVKNDFLFYLVQTEKFNQIANVSSGSKMPRADWNYMSEIPFDIPPLKEQKKIAEILTTWDEAITKQTELIEAKELQKKALMQKLLSGEVRFSGFSGEWEEVRLEEIIKEINLKTTISNQYEVLSVTKSGIYSQQEHFNKQIASEDNTGYKIVKYGNLVFSTMNLWMGSLDIVRNYDIGIVSPAYKVFEINYEKYDIDFIQHYFKSHHMIWLYNMNSEQGASIVRKNLDLNSLLTTKVKIPSFDEQSKIGEVLSLADDEINLFKNELEELKLQKKALMQKLLTGQVMVKV